MEEIKFDGMDEIIVNSEIPRGGAGCGNGCNGVICGGNCNGGWCGYADCGDDRYYC